MPLIRSSRLSSVHAARFVTVLNIGNNERFSRKTDGLIAFAEFVLVDTNECLVTRCRETTTAQPGCFSGRADCVPVQYRASLAARHSAALLGSEQRQSIMKGFIYFSLFVFYQCCFGIEDTNVIALGDWSEPVGSMYGLQIRGRLLMCEYPEPLHTGPHGGYDTGVYLELQEYHGSLDAQVYCNLTCRERGGLRCRLTDGAGNAVQESGGGGGGGAPISQWVRISHPYGSVRLRASDFGGGWLQDGGLGIWFTSAGSWTIKPNDTKAYFLSGTITVMPPTNRVTADFREVWQGALTFPKMKLPPMER
jgi:hypothetical protein